MLGIILALISGALMSIQGVFNTAVTKASSVWVAAGFVQLTAFLTCIAAWLFTGREPILAFWQAEPKYMLLGGVMGAFITFTVIRAMEGLGPARAAMLIVVAQVAVAYVIELFGLFGMEKEPLSWRRLLGLAVSVAGILICKW